MTLNSSVVVEFSSPQQLVTLVTNRSVQDITCVYVRGERVGRFAQLIASGPKFDIATMAAATAVVYFRQKDTFSYVDVMEQYAVRQQYQQQ